MVTKEYEIQSRVRMAVEETNRIIRYSSALFAITDDYFHLDDVSDLDEGWHYFGVSADKKSIVNYGYVPSGSGGSHVLRTVVPANENIEYELVFVKNLTSENDSLISMKLIAHVLRNGVRTNQKIEIETEIEAQNALQVIDKGTSSVPSIALAYRTDDRPTEKEVVAAITMVLDVSGSMNDKMDGSTTNNEAEKRITKVKNALNGYTEGGVTVEGMVNEFAREDNIEICIVPFATSGNYPSPWSTSGTEKHPFYSVSKSASEKTDLRDEIDDLSAYWGTNTGDGMRRAYYRNATFKTENLVSNGYDSSVAVKNFMIILVDGETTFASANGNSVYKLDDGNVSSLSEYRTNDISFNYTGIIGNGSTPSENTKEYIRQIGAKIKSSDTKVYLIGYAPGITDGIQLIADTTGAVKVYQYAPNMNIDEILSEIKSHIMEEIWHLTGPQVN